MNNNEIMEALTNTSHPMVNISYVTKWAISKAAIDVQESPERDIEGQRCITKVFNAFTWDEAAARQDYQAVVDFVNKLAEWDWMHISLAGCTQSDHDSSNYLVVLSMTIKPGSRYWKAG